MFPLSLPGLILRVMGLFNRWLNLIEDSFHITTRQRVQLKWELNYGSRARSDQLAQSRNLSHIDQHSFRLWRVIYYSYLITLACRCLAFFHVVHSNVIALSAYQRLDPFIVISSDYFARHHSFAICLFLLVAFMLQLDYRANVRLLPRNLARPIYELMIVNCDRFWQLNEQIFASGSPVRRRQSMLEQADSLARLWRSAYDTRFQSQRLSCFPSLSARTRARASIIITIVSKFEIMTGLSLLGLFAFLMIFHAQLIIVALIPNLRRLPSAGFQIFLIIVEVLALNFTYLQSLRQAAFIVISAGIWIIVALFHLLECIARLRIVKLRTGPDNLSQVKLIQTVVSFRFEHTILSLQLAELNRYLVSPALSWALVSFVPITIYLVTVLYFLNPPQLARIVYYVGLVGLVGGYFFLVSAPMLYLMDVMYRPAKLLSSLQARMRGRLVTGHKLKLATYHELINTRNRKPVCFTMGTISPLTQWWFVEVFK